MKKIIFIVAIAMVSTAFAYDCQITFEGVASSGYAKGRSAQTVKWYTDSNEELCAQTAKSGLKSRWMQYSKTRNSTSKHRPSFSYTIHYIQTKKATWCTGEIPWHRLSFNTNEENCETIKRED